MPYVRPDVQAFFDAMAALGAPSIIELEPIIARAIAKQGAAQVEAPARPMPRREAQASTRGGGSVPVRIYRPVAGDHAAPVIVFYHGGGWVLGDVEGYDALASEIAHRMGMTVVSVDYRLAPEHRFPAAVEDAIDATRWVAGGPAEIGHPVSSLIVAGDSAGGALAAVVARHFLGDAAVPIGAQWLIYPVTDLSKAYPSDVELAPTLGITDEALAKFYGHYLGTDLDAGKRHPHVSPLLGDAWTGLPPAVVFTCSLDPLRDQGRAYAARLVTEGVETVAYEGVGQIHGSFTMRRMLPSAQADLERGIAALKFLLGR